MTLSRTDTLQKTKDLVAIAVRRCLVETDADHGDVSYIPIEGNNGILCTLQTSNIVTDIKPGNILEGVQQKPYMSVDYDADNTFVSSISDARSLIPAEERKTAYAFEPRLVKGNHGERILRINLYKRG